MIVDRGSVAAEILDDFAVRTGVPGAGDVPDAGDASAAGAPAGEGAPSRRYLWTDAHAVCTWLGLHGETGDERFLRLARGLVDEVHRVLGRRRDDEPRSGWLSGLPEEEGAEHPTAGGLRIGKTLPDRPEGEPPDPATEWDRDGQYFHYLTRWMHALHRVAAHTGEARYHRWAVELAKAAWDGFVVGGGAGGPERMVWKTSVDLSRPVVPSMGHHDPLDGRVTYATLQAATDEMDGLVEVPDLSIEIASFEAMCEGRSWATADPLGTGGLLLAAWREARLVVRGHVPETTRLKWLCREAWRSLEGASREVDPSAPWSRRLAFRELGLALGLRGVERLVRLAEVDRDLSRDEALSVRIESLAGYVPLADALERSWLEPEAGAAATWREHEDINAVTLAASLAPGGWLGG